MSCAAGQAADVDKEGKDLDLLQRGIMVTLK